MHTYIHNCSLQYFWQDFDLIAHTTSECVNFYTWVEFQKKKKNEINKKLNLIIITINIRNKE